MAPCGQCEISSRRSEYRKEHSHCFAGDGVILLRRFTYITGRFKLGMLSPDFSERLINVHDASTAKQSLDRNAAETCTQAFQ
jgi:hypothetical protein